MAQELKSMLMERNIDVDVAFLEPEMVDEHYLKKSGFDIVLIAGDEAVDFLKSSIKRIKEIPVVIWGSYRAYDMFVKNSNVIGIRRRIYLREVVQYLRVIYPGVNDYYFLLTKNDLSKHIAEKVMYELKNLREELPNIGINMNFNIVEGSTVEDILNKFNQLRPKDRRVFVLYGPLGMFMSKQTATNLVRVINNLKLVIDVALNSFMFKNGALLGIYPPCNMKLEELVNKISFLVEGNKKPADIGWFDVETVALFLNRKVSSVSSRKIPGFVYDMAILK